MSTVIELAREWLKADPDVVALVGNRVRASYSPEDGAPALLLSGSERDDYNPGQGYSGRRDATLSVFVMADDTEADYPDLTAAKAAAQAVVSACRQIPSKHFKAVSGEQIIEAQVMAHTPGPNEGIGIARRALTISLRIAD